MPLIILSGLPSSGKSTRANELSRYFTERNKKCIILSENDSIPKGDFQKNEYFADSQKEKIIRSNLKSEVTRLLNKSDIIILDSGNYIKGYRYELYCVTKSARTTQCTLFCGITKEEASKLNKTRHKTEQDLSTSRENNSNIAYTDDIFDALCLRYEEPHGNNRWDSPLFTVFPGDTLDMDSIYDSLFEKKPPPPNQSTQNPPLTSNNYLHELDRLTQDVVNKITSSRKIGISGPINLTDKLTVDIPSELNASQLNRIRRQFLNYHKLHGGGGSAGHSAVDLDKGQQLFVQFLNSNC